MKSVTLKNIDFSKGDSESREFKFENPLEISSPKSVAFVIQWQRARKRAGSAKVKSMAEISGTTAKPYKQKGTGNARQGSKRSVQFVGGRTCHGPTPRSFDFTMPKKISKKALSDALIIKLKEGKVSLFKDFGKEIKTSKVSQALKKNKINDVLIITDLSNNALAKSARNIKNVKVLDAKGINVYDLLNFENVLIDSQIFEKNIMGAIA
ncbi:MAG: 50S ribosomal protein L4 [Rickettsiales bacterium]|nr:50S ribosomal protein L4 [Rickettsiales bacterium]